MIIYLQRQREVLTPFTEVAAAKTVAGQKVHGLVVGADVQFEGF